MRKLFIILMILLTGYFLYSQDNSNDVKFLKKGSIVEFDCYAVPPEKMNKLLEYPEINQTLEQALNESDKKLKLKDMLIKEKDNQIEKQNEQIAIYIVSDSINKQLVQMYKDDYSNIVTLKLQNKILGISTGVCVSIALAELAGIIVYSVLQNGVKF